jgi:hypothetical protein
MHPRSFVVISQRLIGLEFLGFQKDASFSDPRLRTMTADLEYIVSEANRTGLPLSAKQAARVLELWNGDRNSALYSERLGQAASELHNRLLDELDSRLFYVVGQDKAKFLDQNWLSNSKINEAFPSAVPEFKRAGRCFAYTENTACVFHLMRVVDLGLRTVAASLQASYDARNWSGIADKINKLMEQKYQLKTDEWKKSEPFYASVLTDIQAISKAYRNEGVHDARRVYEEADADYLLTVVEHFMANLAANGMKETP